MSKRLFVILGLICFSACLVSSTIANIVEIKGQSILIDKGRIDGVSPNMKGIIRATFKDPSGEYDVNIGLFTVGRVDERTSLLNVENLASGFKLSDARYVVFDDTLKPPHGTTVSDSTEKAIAVDLVEEGDRLSEDKQYSAALEKYRKAQELEPQNLVIREKVRFMQKRIDESVLTAKYSDNLRKADVAIEQKDVRFAFLYLAEALKVYPSGREDVRKRLLLLANEYPDEFKMVSSEKEKEIGEMNKLVQEIRTISKPSLNKEEQPVADTEEVPTTEKFLQSVKGKVKTLNQNDEGFWEATFEDNLVMIYISEGEFTFGSPDDDGDEDEHPAHKVFLKGYWIGKFEVTFEQYARFCKETKMALPVDEGWGRGDLPVIYVNWEDCRKYCAWLSKKTGLSFRLPTEAEWERAAHDYYPWGSASPDEELCNFNGILGRTVAVGSYPRGASRYGVMDLAGNVWEWLADWYSADYYGRSPLENPRGPENGQEKVVRGGCWEDSEDLIRSANRSSENPLSKINKIGFRLVLESR